MTDGGPVSVELDVFSGRRNPTWTLDRADARRLLDALETLPPPRPAAPGLSGLGFRGYVVTIPGAHRLLRVADGRVSEGTAEREDPGGRVALLLRDSAPSDIRSSFGPLLGG